MSNRTTETQDTPPTASQNDSIDQSRRRLTGATLGASAIFTLASRPVLAAQCTSASAAASGNLSQHGPVITCSGKTAAIWAETDKQNYPGGNPGGNPKFMDVFNNGTYANWGANDRLDNVLDAGDNGNTGSTPNPISKEFAAALLNIRAGSVPASVLTEMQLIGMWNEWVIDGIFNPKAGAEWGTNQIITYLQTLQA